MFNNHTCRRRATHHLGWTRCIRNRGRGATLAVQVASPSRAEDHCHAIDDIPVRVCRAIDSAGDTIDFLLSPNRDLVAAKGFLRLALSAGNRPRVINVDGHPAYASAISELKQEGDLRARDSAPCPEH